MIDRAHLGLPPRGCPIRAKHGACRPREPTILGVGHAGTGASAFPAPASTAGCKPSEKQPDRDRPRSAPVADRSTGQPCPAGMIRGLLRRGREHLSEKHATKLNTCLIAGDPGWQVSIAWHAYQQLRSVYQAETPARGRTVAEKVIDSFPNCPIPEVARLGRTLKMWKSHVPVRFETHRISNGGTEAPRSWVTRAVGGAVHTADGGLSGDRYDRPGRPSAQARYARRSNERRHPWDCYARPHPSTRWGW